LALLYFHGCLSICCSYKPVLLPSGHFQSLLFVLFHPGSFYDFIGNKKTT
jgi:hypothetical protein